MVPRKWHQSSRPKHASASGLFLEYLIRKNVFRRLIILTREEALFFLVEFCISELGMLQRKWIHSYYSDSASSVYNGGSVFSVVLIAEKEKKKNQ